MCVRKYVTTLDFDGSIICYLRILARMASGFRIPLSNCTSMNFCTSLFSPLHGGSVTWFEWSTSTLNRETFRVVVFSVFDPSTIPPLCLHSFSRWLTAFIVGLGLIWRIVHVDRIIHEARRIECTCINKMLKRARRTDSNDIVEKYINKCTYARYTAQKYITITVK